MCGKMKVMPGMRSLADQVIRSAASIGANIVEARGSGSRLEYTRFFRIALKSANETCYWLELIRDIAFAPTDSVTPLIDESTQLRKMLASAVLKLNIKNEDR